VAVQFREAGLSEVRLQEFETEGVPGVNVVGALRARGPELVVLGAHHDTAPDAPGAYDDGGGVGVLVEVARALAREPTRTRSFVFVSFDGEEAWSTGKTTTAGSRAWLESLGAEARTIVAALVIEMCGWKGGTPVLHPIPYRDPREAGRSVVSPAWLVRAALNGAGADLRVGDPLLSWIYQPAVRTFRAGLYGDDLSFLQAGVPAVFVSDSSFSAFYPWYHQPGDTADKLDAASLARMGEAVRGAALTLDRVARGPAEEPQWFSAFGWVFGRPVLVSLGLASLIPGMRGALRARGLTLGARLLHALLFGFLLWRHAVPALWIFFVANLLPPGGGPGRKVLAILPPVALVALGISAWRRGMVDGLWPAPWEVAIALLAFALLFVRAPESGVRRTGRRKRV
jgi:hypothetical protein